MTAPNPQQMRALAYLSTGDYRFRMSEVRTALRTAADQLEAMPTHKEIAEALHRSDESTSYDPFYYDRGADAVLALLNGHSDD